MVVLALLVAACGGTAGGDAASRPEVVAASADAEPRALSGNSDYLFAQDRLHTFELTIPQASLDRIDEDPVAEEWVEGELTFEGENLGAVGVRYKGSIGSFVGCTAEEEDLEPSGRKTCTKISMKVKTNWVDADQEFYGQRRLQFHSHNLDPTALHERLGYWLFDEMGVESPRSTHARLVINGEFVGMFGLTEQVDGRFTRDRFDDGTGNLYKGQWPFNSEFRPASDDDLIQALKTNEDEDPDTATVRNFAAELLAVPVSEQRAVLDTWTDVDDLLAYSVVDRAIRHDDGPFHWYCSENGCGNQNFYWYSDPSEQRLHLIPWDLDGAFENLRTENPYTAVADGWGEVTDDCEIFAYGELDRLQRSAACDPLTAALATLDADRQALVDEFVNGPFSATEVNDRIDEWVEQIQPAIEEAAALHDDAITVEEWLAAVADFREDLELSHVALGGAA